MAPIPTPGQRNILAHTSLLARPNSTIPSRASSSSDSEEDDARPKVSSGLKPVQREHGRQSLGATTSSRRDSDSGGVRPGSAGLSGHRIDASERPYGIQRSTHASNHRRDDPRRHTLGGPSASNRDQTSAPRRSNLGYVDDGSNAVAGPSGTTHVPTPATHSHHSQQPEGSRRKRPRSSLGTPIVSPNGKRHRRFAPPPRPINPLHPPVVAATAATPRVSQIAHRPKPLPRPSRLSLTHSQGFDPDEPIILLSDDEEVNGTHPGSDNRSKSLHLTTAQVNPIPPVAAPHPTSRSNTPKSVASPPPRTTSLAHPSLQKTTTTVKSNPPQKSDSLPTPDNRVVSVSPSLRRSVSRLSHGGPSQATQTSPHAPSQPPAPLPLPAALKRPLSAAARPNAQPPSAVHAPTAPITSSKPAPSAQGPPSQRQLDELLLLYKQKQEIELQRQQEQKRIVDDVFTSSGHANEQEMEQELDIADQREDDLLDDGLDELEGGDDEEMGSEDSPSRTPTKSSHSQPLLGHLSIAASLPDVSSKANLLLQAQQLLESLPSSQPPIQTPSLRAATPAASISVVRPRSSQNSPALPTKASIEARQAVEEARRRQIAEEETRILEATQEEERTQEGLDLVNKQLNQDEIIASIYLIQEQAKAVRAEALRLDAVRRRKEEEMESTRIEVEKAEEEKRREVERIRVLEAQREAEIAAAAIAEAERSQLAQEQKEAEIASAKREEAERLLALQAKKDAELAAAAKVEAEKMRVAKEQKEAEIAAAAAAAAAAEVEAARVKKAEQAAARKLQREKKKEADAAEARRVEEAERLAELVRVEDRRRRAEAEDSSRRQAAKARAKQIAALDAENLRVSRETIIQHVGQGSALEADPQQSGADSPIATLSTLRHLREMKYWSILDSQGGKAESGDVAHDVWLRAVGAVNEWRLHRLENWWERKTCQSWSSTTFQLVRTRMEQAPPIGTFRDGVMLKAAAETKLRIQSLWDGLSPEDRKARVLKEKASSRAMATVDWDGIAQVAVEAEAVRLATEQREELLRIRHERTAAEKDLLSLVISGGRSTAQSPQAEDSSFARQYVPTNAAAPGADHSDLRPLQDPSIITESSITSHEQERLNGLAHLQANQSLQQIVSAPSTPSVPASAEPEVPPFHDSVEKIVSTTSDLPLSDQENTTSGAISTQEVDPDPRLYPRKSRIDFSSQDFEDGSVYDNQDEQYQPEEEDQMDLEVPDNASPDNGDQFAPAPDPLVSTSNGIGAATPPPSSPLLRRVEQNVPAESGLPTSRTLPTETQRLLDRRVNLRPAPQSPSDATDLLFNQALQRIANLPDAGPSAIPTLNSRLNALGLPERPSQASLDAVRSSANAADELRASRMSNHTRPTQNERPPSSFGISPVGAQAPYSLPPRSQPGDGTGTNFVPRAPPEIDDSRNPTNDHTALEDGGSYAPSHPTSISTALLPGRVDTPAHDSDAYTSDAPSSSPSAASVSEPAATTSTKSTSRKRRADTSESPPFRVRRSGRQFQNRKSSRNTKIRRSYVFGALSDEEREEAEGEQGEKNGQVNCGRSQEHPPGSLPTPSATESPAPDPRRLSTHTETLQDLPPQPRAGPSRSSPRIGSKSIIPPSHQGQNHDRDLLAKYGVFLPDMKGRKDNKWTSWSTKIVPGTLHDLMWELDLIYMPDDRERPLMRRAEEDVVWGEMREYGFQIKGGFCSVVGTGGLWNAGIPLRADNPVPFLRGWIVKYGEIMRFAGIDQEVIDTFHILMKNNLIGIQTHLNACKHWNRHMRYYRLMKARPLPQDEDCSDVEEHVKKGTIQLREFQVGGREYAEMQERAKAKEEGRAPVLPQERYYFGMPN